MVVMHLILGVCCEPLIGLVLWVVLNDNDGSRRLVGQPSSTVLKKLLTSSWLFRLCNDRKRKSYVGPDFHVMVTLVG